MSTAPWVGYGGTFDPVHCGHLAVARRVRDALGAEVCLVPAGDPPHKHGMHVTTAHRLRMLELAASDEARLRVDPRELSRAGPSYSVATLEDVRSQVGPSRPVIWVVGADSLAQLHRWHRWRDLFASGHLLAVGRPGHGLDPVQLGAVCAELASELSPRLAATAALTQSPAGSLALLPMDPPRPESSTLIRRTIAAGGDASEYLPPAVAAYIARHRLYASGAAA